METGTRVGSLPRSPATAVSPSMRIEPIISFDVASLKDVLVLATTETTSARAKGSAVGPRSRNRWPKAKTRLPSISVTVPCAPTLKSPASSITLIIEPGFRSAGLPILADASPPPESICRGSRPSCRNCGAKASSVARLNPPKLSGVAISTMRASPAAAGEGRAKRWRRSASANSTRPAGRAAAVAEGRTMSSIGRIAAIGSLANGKAIATAPASLPPR